MALPPTNRIKRVCEAVREVLAVFPGSVVFRVRWGSDGENKTCETNCALLFGGDGEKTLGRGSRKGNA